MDFLLENDSVLGPFSTAQEDLIWALRQRRKQMDRTGKEVDLLKQMQERSVSILQFQKETRAQMLASLVPDEVIANITNYSPREGFGSVLYGEVSGFLELLEIYKNPENGGPSKMTAVLNKYMGSVVEEVMAHGGDILKFSGDYFLGFWKCAEKSLRYSVNAAINCALIILKKFGNYETAEGTLLKMKLIITAGPLVFSLIGDLEVSHYVLVGQPIDDIKEAEQKANSGEIIVSPSAYMHVMPSDYLSKETEDGTHYRILGVGPNWRYGEKDYATRRNKEEYVEELEQDETGESEIKILRRTEDFSLRPSILTAVDSEESLTKFMVVPVLQALDTEEGLGGLVEVRQVVVMFVNIVAKKNNAFSTIAIIDNCYRVVCSKVNEHKGVVLKVSLFDKDVMVFIVFGLRGFNNVLESGEALKCAIRTQHELQLIEEVQSVSIACTTGKCYCGIFGHNLRRDYSVIGYTVLKAAKMMIAYPDRVTCDRQTFIYSKLGVDDFNLMVYKKLTGVPNQGTIYEYKQDSQLKPLSKNFETFPMLGRSKELATFKKLFETYLTNFGIDPCCKYHKCTYKNCIIIEGQKKQGKTRLLQEFACDLGKVQVTSIVLEKGDIMSSYHSIRCIFDFAFKFKRFTLEAYRRQKIMKKVNSVVQPPEFLCALNDVFDVNFPIPDRFRNASDLQRRTILLHSIQRLCKLCFIDPTVVFIDNADFMDEETWNIITALLETKRFFLVMAMNHLKAMGMNQKKTLKSHHVERMYLKKIPNIYHAALACQILGVYAIPADLENVIQSNSSGNPGWIENFLTSLQQSRKIFIQHIDVKGSRKSGLVFPPLYLMKRMDDETIKKYKRLMEENDDYSSPLKKDPWDVYIECCRDEILEASVMDAFANDFCHLSNEMPVCYLAKGFNVVLDVDPEITEDLDVLELYDSLSTEEKSMVKCASILGDPFTRRILFYVWSPETPRIGAEIIQKVFEKKILCCAKGDFSSGGDYVLLRDRSMDPSKERRVDCHCLGLDIHDTCLFMPKYASCGIMRFRSPKLRNTTYSLMSEDLKKDLHIKASKFIQKETRRCVACGCTYFSPIPGCHLDSTPSGRVRVQRKKSLHLHSMAFDELLDYSTSRSTRATLSSVSAGRMSRHSLTFKESFLDRKLSSIGEEKFAQEEYDGGYANNKKVITPISMYKLKTSISLIRRFSSSDFMSCECHLILNHMFKRLKEHFRGAGQWSDMIVASFYYIRVSITNNNYAAALNTVKECFDVLKEKEQLFNEPKWKIRVFLGKFYSLQGIVFMHLDQMDEAYASLMDAMRYFGVAFPEKRIKLSFRLSSLKQKWKQKLALYFLPGSLLGPDDDVVNLHISNSISETLHHLCRIFMSRGEWKLAEFAGVWSLQNSLQAETSLIRICEAFINMIALAHHSRNKLLGLCLEIHALKYCHKKRNFVEVPELRAVSQLYTAIFEARLTRADFEDALQIGYVAVHISTTCTENNVTIKLFNLLTYILLSKMFIHEASSILHELEYFSDEIDNNSGKFWYYALSIGFHLETGYIQVPLNVVEIFVNGEGANFNEKFYDAKMRLVVTMWVWYLRNDMWEAAAVFYREIEAYRSYKIDSSTHAINMLYLLEGTLLTLVNKINKRSISGIRDTKKEVEKLFKKLNKWALREPFILTRLNHLVAYFWYIQENDDNIKKFLKKAKSVAIKHDNKMELLHIEHSDKAWNNELTTTVRDFWKNHCTSDAYLTRQDMDFDDLKIYCYTYPMPQFGK